MKAEEKSLRFARSTTQWVENHNRNSQLATFMAGPHSLVVGNVGSGAKPRHQMSTLPLLREWLSETFYLQSLTRLQLCLPHWGLIRIRWNNTGETIYNRAQSCSPLPTSRSLCTVSQQLSGRYKEHQFYCLQTWRVKEVGHSANWIKLEFKPGPVRFQTTRLQRMKQRGIFFFF